MCKVQGDSVGIWLYRYRWIGKGSLEKSGVGGNDFVPLNRGAC